MDSIIHSELLRGFFHPVLVEENIFRDGWFYFPPVLLNFFCLKRSNFHKDSSHLCFVSRYIMYGDISAKAAHMLSKPEVIFYVYLS